MERMTADFRTQFTADSAQAVIRAAVIADVATFATPDERTDRIMRALAKADLIIVPKLRGNVDAVREAVRTGDWSAVSERDLMAWREVPIPGNEIALMPEQVALVQDDTLIFNVRVGWPEYRNVPVIVPKGSDVATVARDAKDFADICFPYPGRTDRSRWVAYSLEERRFLAPDEPAPLRFVIGPYEELCRQWWPDEEPRSAADITRYEARWETGLRNIVTILHGAGHAFEIRDIVEEVRALKEGQKRMVPIEIRIGDGRLVFRGEPTDLPAFRAQLARLAAMPDTEAFL